MNEITIANTKLSIGFKCFQKSFVIAKFLNIGSSPQRAKIIAPKM